MDQLSLPTALCHSLLVVGDHNTDSDNSNSPEAPRYSPFSDTTDDHNADSDNFDSPEAPQHSPFSDTADDHHDGQTSIQNISEDDQEPETETESIVSHIPL